jgi:hypothetical protein
MSRKKYKSPSTDVTVTRPRETNSLISRLALTDTDSGNSPWVAVKYTIGKGFIMAKVIFQVYGANMPAGTQVWAKVLLSYFLKTPGPDATSIFHAHGQIRSSKR